MPSFYTFIFNLDIIMFIHHCYFTNFNFMFKITIYSTFKFPIQPVLSYLSCLAYTCSILIASEWVILSRFMPIYKCTSYYCYYYCYYCCCHYY